jgi:multiple antibiotic resistance protein
VVPLAIPLLAGPGPISTIIVYGSRSTGVFDDLIYSGIVVLVSTVIAIIFSTTNLLGKILTPTRVKIITKISGLLVAAIAVEMIYTSIVALNTLHPMQ